MPTESSLLEGLEAFLKPRKRRDSVIKFFDSLAIYQNQGITLELFVQVQPVANSIQAISILPDLSSAGSFVSVGRNSIDGNLLDSVCILKYLTYLSLTFADRVAKY